MEKHDEKYDIVYTSEGVLGWLPIWLVTAVIVRGSANVQAGGRTLRLKPADLAPFRGERAQRGGHLPRGLTRVDALRVEGG